MTGYFFLGLRLKAAVLLIEIIFIFNWHLFIAASEIKMRVPNITEFTLCYTPSLLISVLTVVFTSSILWLHLPCISFYFGIRVTSGLLQHKRCYWCRGAVSTVFYRSSYTGQLWEMLGSEFLPYWWSQLPHCWKRRGEAHHFLLATVSCTSFLASSGEPAKCK